MKCPQVNKYRDNPITRFNVPLQLLHTKCCVLNYQYPKRNLFTPRIVKTTVQFLTCEELFYKNSGSDIVCMTYAFR